MFRKTTISKRRNRDTAWFAAIDAEWPSLQIAIENWLQRDNFEAVGQQKLSLSAMTEPVLVLGDPMLASQE